MLIVSQTRKKAVNLDNIAHIFIINNSVEYGRMSGHEANPLGEYETEERAKEVLQEIIDMYKSTESFKASANRVSDSVGALAIKKGFVYYMPLQ